MPYRILKIVEEGSRQDEIDEEVAKEDGASKVVLPPRALARVGDHQGGWRPGIAAVGPPLQ
eukprot:CAMPEP_0180038854 /NCGR_PEP_ID=MMETSP0984-20121128/32464_1 /TAXON_ID=483367 /ORGANISM="non described non described, Strain CCMP 2436" /LENGTH=60 /DNA_ID=CAMNT_0021965687 /DNA_START=201 /DNA_END=380 /DNA_ORIENTATION=+